MSALIQLLDRPIAYNPAFAKLRAGKIRSGPVAAIFLSQLVYWHNRMDGGWMYKTQADIASETSLTRDEQETARKRLVALGVLDEELRGVPATMHYRINTARLEVLLTETTRPAQKANQAKTRLRNLQNVETPQTGMVQPSKLVCGDAANKNGGTTQTRMGDTSEQACGDPANFHTGDYTESTQEITQDKNPCQLPAETDDPAQQVLDHFNRATNSGYRDGKTTMGYIRGRLLEDYSAEDLILVVDYLTAKWLDDPKMGDYLRPRTLFGPENCAEYFEKAKKWRESGRPVCVNGKWLKPGEKSGSDNSERDAAYRRFMGSALPLRNPGEHEVMAKKEAGKADVRRMQPGYAVSAWNRIWAECAQRLNGGKAA